MAREECRNGVEAVDVNEQKPLEEVTAKRRGSEEEGYREVYKL